jgi:hypothetical protein
VRHSFLISHLPVMHLFRGCYFDVRLRADVWAMRSTEKDYRNVFKWLGKTVIAHEDGGLAGDLLP